MGGRRWEWLAQEAGDFDAHSPRPPRKLLLVLVSYNDIKRQDFAILSSQE